METLRKCMKTMILITLFCGISFINTTNATISTIDDCDVTYYSSSIDVIWATGIWTGSGDVWYHYTINSIDYTEVFSHTAGGGQPYEYYKFDALELGDASNIFVTNNPNPDYATITVIC